MEVECVVQSNNLVKLEGVLAILGVAAVDAVMGTGS